MVDFNIVFVIVAIMMCVILFFFSMFYFKCHKQVRSFLCLSLWRNEKTVFMFLDLKCLVFVEFVCKIIL